jgi:hypothetical protein
MKLEDFKYWNNPKYIETCEKIINHQCCINVKCSSCPFDYDNLIDENHDCSEYSDTRACDLPDDKLIQSAKEFLEMVEFQKRVEFTATAKSLIDENEYMKLSKIMNPDEYIIVDQNACICSEVNALRLAEEFVDNSLQKDSGNTFTIYKKIKTGKSKVNVETEWLE